MACTARAISRNLPPHSRVPLPEHITSSTSPWARIALRATPLATDPPSWPGRTKVSQTAPACGAILAHGEHSLATHDARRDYGGETTDRGRSLFFTSACPRVDPLQVDRAIDAGRARAVICGTNEQQALSAVAAAHGVESQRDAPVHGHGAEVMSLRDSPAAQPWWVDTPRSAHAIGTGRGAAGTPVQLCCIRAAAGGEVGVDAGTEGSNRS